MCSGVFSDADGAEKGVAPIGSRALGNAAVSAVGSAGVS